MPKPGRPKKKQPLLEISDHQSDIFTFSLPSSSSSSSPGLFRVGEKRGHPQSSPENENQNQKPTKKTTKLNTTTDSIPSIPFPPLSPKQHLQKALESLTQAYKGLEAEGKEEKEQVKKLEDYTRSILAGETPFIQGKEKAKEVLRELVEEVRALRKEAAPTKETYAERLKKNLPSSSSLPSLSSTSSPPLPFTPSPSSRSPTSTRSKKRQLQKRKLVLITDEKD